MFKTIVIAAALLALTACGDAQRKAEATKKVCIDGVQYLSFKTGRSTRGITAHLKPDGKPFTCSA